MAIVGNKREPMGEGFVRKVGLAVCEPIIINPDKKELEELLQRKMEEAPQYLTKDEDGKTRLDLHIWLKEIKTEQRFKLRMKLVDKKHQLSETGKVRFVDNKGNTSYWLDNESNLADFMKKNNPRIAKEGEVELYKFMRAHQDELDFMGIEDFSVDWSRLMRGDVGELNELKHSDFASTVLVTLAVRIDRRDGELKHYQTVYNRAFLSGGYMKYFKNGGVSKPKAVVEFIEDVTNKKYGCRDFFGKDRVLREMYDYDPAENLLASDSPVLAGEVDDDNGDGGKVEISTDY